MSAAQSPWSELGAGAAASSRQTRYSLLILLLLCGLCAPFFFSPIDQSAPRASDGILNLSGRETLKAPIELEGEWRFAWKTPQLASQTPTTMRVPGTWEGKPTRDGASLPGQGRAVYALTIRGLPKGSYRLYVPTIFAANHVSVDDVKAVPRGQIGDDAATTRYFWRAQEVSLLATGGDVRITIEIAAFLHRDNGIEAAPILGTDDQMQTVSALRWSQELMFQTSLMLIGVFSFVVYLFRRSDIPSLCHAIASALFMPVTALLGFDNILLLIFPSLSFPALLGLVYISTGVSLAYFLTYAHTLFPDESPRRSYLAMLGLVVGFFGLQALALVVSGTLLTSEINSWLVFVLIIVFGYIIWVLLRAVRQRRDGAIPFLLGMVMLFVTMIMLAIVSAGYVPQNQVKGFGFTTFGILILLFSHIVVLAERWSLSINASQRSNEELRQLLDVNSSIASEIKIDALLNRIVEATSRILNAERSSIFLHDAKGNTLWSMVAEGLETRQIRFPANEGLAGACLTKGEVIITPDAYADPQFKRDFDVETGFRTRNVICAPINARDGRKLGVMQALNRKDDGAFTLADVARMKAFAAQTAIALDNAQLFADVEEQRNYSECILGSMSSAVITLDIEARIVKINDATRAIFKLGDADVIGRDARSQFAAGNAAIVAELEAAAAKEEIRNLFDVEIVVADRSTIAANMAVVPLMNGKTRVGLLMIIEDISEGKRLQGAMRRFMPQEVVNEVLGRGDDLMFGSAVPASVLFADIRGFTSMAEALSARETVDMLNEIFTDLYEAISSTEGMIDKYIGDAIMAVYGAPLPGQNDAVNAVNGALEVLRMVDMLNVRRGARGLPKLRMGLGIASGEVVAGTIGSPKRMDYTVIGDSVNLASRLQDATKGYGISTIVCEGTAAKVAATHRLRTLDRIRVRGRQQPAQIYELLTVGGIPDAAVAAYESGLSRLTDRDWVGAMAAFDLALSVTPDDAPSALMRRRAAAAMAEPPPPDWDGVW